MLILDQKKKHKKRRSQNIFFWVLAFLFLSFTFISQVSAAEQWVSDPGMCNVTDPLNFPGQNCSPTYICGDDTGIAQCYNTISLLPPALSATSNISYSASYPNGGYIVNCYATVDAAAPYCDNSGNYWCNRSSNCYSTQHRNTICTANLWADASCGTCRTGFGDCDSGGDSCEIQFGVTNYPTGANNNYADCSTAQCDSGYLDCNASGAGAGDGCEIQNGSACMVGSLPGVWNGCTCEVPKQYFETGTETSYSTADPLLWGVQYGSGDLIHFGTEANPDLFVVNNDGAVQMAQITAPAITTDRLYNVAGSLYWNGVMIGAGGGGDNIYTADGVVAANRLVDVEDKELTIGSTLGGGYIVDIVDGTDRALINMHSDEMGFNVDDFDSNGSMVFNAGGASINYNGPVGSTNLFIGSNAEFYDTVNSRGLVYGGDYEVNFLPRSLVTKQYVDGVAGGDGGWTDDGTVVRLTTSTDRVGIANSSPKSVLDIGEAMLNTPAGDISVVLGRDGGDSFFETYSTDMSEGLIMHGATGNPASYDYGVVRNLYSNHYGNGWERGLHIFTGDDGTMSDPIIFSIDGNELARMTDAGYLGIGTDTPYYPLQVSGNDVVAYFQSSSSSRGGVVLGNLGMYSGDESGLYDAGGDYPLAVYDASNDTVKLGHQITVDTVTGFIGMNEASPLAQLEITDFNSSDFEPLLLLSHGGAGQSVGLLPVGADPDGTVTAPRGSLAMDYANGALYINRNGLTDWQSLMVGTSIWDGDSDTGIEVEQSSDEDFIRMSTAGEERFRIDANGHFRVGSGSGGSDALFEVGAGSEPATFAVQAVPGFLNIATFRDEDGENIFRAKGSLNAGDLNVTFGDTDTAYSGGGMEIFIDNLDNYMEIQNMDLRFPESSSLYADYVGFKAPGAISSSVIWTLPDSDGTAGQALVTDGAGTLSWASGDSGWSLTGNAGTNPALNFIGTTDAQPFIVKTNNTEAMRVDTDGNVSIGTTSTAGRFYVHGGSSDPVIARFSNTDVPDGFAFGADMYGGEAGLYEMLNGQLLVGHDINDENILMLGQYLAYGDQTTKNFSLNTSTLTHSLLVQGNTTTVGDNLFKVQGGTDGSYLSIYVPTGAERDTNIQWQRDLRFLPGAASSPAMIISHSSQVGIGTTSPDRLFHVETVDSANSSISYAGRFSHVLSGIVSPPTVGFGTGLEFELENAVSTNRVAGTIENIWGTAVNGSEDSELIFKTMLDGTLAERMRIDDQGFVGIGTSSPLSKLTLAANNSLTDASLLRFLSSNDSSIQSEIYLDGGGNATYWDVNSSGDGGALIIENYTTELAKFTNSGLIINEGSAASVDFRVESDTNTHALFVDATNGYVGFDQSSPAAKLHVGNTSSGSAADYNYLQLDGSGDVQHKLYLPTASNLMIWDFNGTGNGGAIEFRDYNTRIGMFTNSGLVINDGGAAGVGLRVEGDTQTHLLYTDGTNDRVGVGTNSPAVRFHVVQSDHTVAAFDRTDGDGVLVALQRDGVNVGSISTFLGIVSYNAFTGSHYTWHEGSIEKGTVVSLTGQNKYLHDDPGAEILYGVEECAQINSPKVLGSYLALLEPLDDLATTNPGLVMAVGNGEVWVTDKGENIEAGDYLISSDVIGHAQKMDANLALNYVFARAAEDVDWSTVSETSTDGIKHKIISVFFDTLVVNTQTVDVIKDNDFLGSRLDFSKMDVDEVSNLKSKLGSTNNVSESSVQIGQTRFSSGKTQVHVNFENEFVNAPIVMLTLASDSNLMRYYVTNVSKNGFNVSIYPSQMRETLINWQAIPASADMVASDGDEIVKPVKQETPKVEKPREDYTILDAMEDLEADFNNIDEEDINNENENILIIEVAGEEADSDESAEELGAEEEVDNTEEIGAEEEANSEEIVEAEESEPEEAVIQPESDDEVEAAEVIEVETAEEVESPADAPAETEGEISESLSHYLLKNVLALKRN